MTLALASFGAEQTRAATSDDFVVFEGRPVHPTRMLARLADPETASAHASALSGSGIEAARSSALVPGLLVLELQSQVAVMGGTATASASGTPSDRTNIAELAAAIESLRASGLYAYVEPDYLLSRTLIPTDSAFLDDTLWGLRNSGQAGGVTGMDVDAVRAWDVTTGSSDIVVAVLDTGIRYTHRDLATNMWRNPREIPGNGRDDDRNGYIDDVFGINAINGTGDPMDEDGHGTHVAGTIGAAANDGNPMVGVAWNVRLMACKFLDGDGRGFTSDAVEAVNYAVANGARIINASWGGESYSQALHDSIAAAGTRGVLVVAAAGNDSRDTDQHPSYPGSYDLENVVNVAAMDRYGQRAGFSNIGRESVDLAAPGVDIHSSLAQSDTAYGLRQGTSMAAPHVSGVAALVLARFPDNTVGELRDRLLRTTIATAAFEESVATGGRVSAYRAVSMMPTGQLSVDVQPRPGSALFNGQQDLLVARVHDLVRVSGATVTATITGVGTVQLRDDGIAPDSRAGDAIYMGTFTAPASGETLPVTLQATAPGKTSAQLSFDYVLRGRPGNDMFADRTVISGPHGRWSATNRGASREAAEPVHAGRPGGPSVWWSWTAPADTTVTLDTLATNFDTLLAVYTGTDLGTLVPVASNDNDPEHWRPFGGSRLTFTAERDKVYQIAVDGALGATGEFRLTLRSTIPPANDDFADAIAIFGEDITVSGTILGATKEDGEPNPPFGGGPHSVWWKWTAPTSGTATVSSLAPEFGSDVEVYVGESVVALVRVPGRVPELENSWSAPHRVTFSAVAGTTYAIAVIGSSEGAGLGDYTLTLALVDAPANDRFVDRIPLFGENVTTTGNNASATRDIGEPIDATSQFGATVWWTWTAPRDGTLVLDAAGSVIDPRLRVFTGHGVEALELVAPGGHTPHAQYGRETSVRVVAGTAYHIAVDSGHFATFTGPITLALRLLDTPSNDDFARRIQLTGTSASASGTNVGATREPSEPEVRHNHRSATVWWTWVAHADGMGMIDIVGNGHIVAVFTGASMSTLTRVPNLTAADDRHSFRAAAGEAYQIAVDSYWLPGPFSLAVSFAPRPANDAFSAPSLLAGRAATVSGETGGATTEPDEPAIPGLGPHRTGSSVWWQWTAPADGTARLTGTAAAVATFTGDSLATLVPVADGDPDTSSCVFHASAGVTYRILVDGYNSAATTQYTLDLQLVDGPANDLFADRAPLSGSFVQVGTDLRDATIETGEPDHAGSPPRKTSLWWTWTAPADGTVVLSASDPYTLVFAVYTGADLPALQIVPAIVDAPYLARREFVATRGTTYQIALVAYSGFYGTADWSLRLVPPVTNDAFRNRASLSGASVSVPAANLGATLEAGEPTPSLQASVWWTWTAPANGNAYIRIVDNEFIAAVALYSGSSLATLTPIPSISPNIYRVAAGTTYQIQVGSTNVSTGAFTLSLEFFVPAANDDFADRTPLVGRRAETTGSSRGASSELDEPPHDRSFSGGASTWWSWMAPADGIALLQARSDEFEPIVAAYRGTSVTSLQQVPGNQDSRERPSRLAFTVFAGVTYQLVLDGYLGRTGAFTLSIEMLDPPANDRFADREALTGAECIAYGTHLAATAEPGEPAHVGSPAAKSSWWSWTAPFTGTARLDVLPVETGYHAQPAIYTGSTLGALLPLVHGSMWGASALFPATAGVTYHIAVDTTDAWGGDYFVELRLADVPANDFLSLRAPITGAFARIQADNAHATIEAAELSIGGLPRRSLWWEWTAPETGRAVLSIAASDFEPALAVHRPGAGWNMETVDTSHSFRRIQNIDTAFDVVGGETYLLSVDTISENGGSFELRLDLVDPPANDDFAGRIVLSGTGANLVASNFGAAGEPFDPFGNYPTSLWWSWTAPENARLRVSTAGSDFDTAIWIGAGQTIDDLQTLATNLYDEPQLVSDHVLTDVVAGQTYHIAVTGRHGATGEIRLDVSRGHAPPALGLQTLDTPPVAGSATTLRAAVADSEGLSFQWLHDGREIEGATGATYEIPITQAFDAGSYAVRVTNAFGSTTGIPTILAVAPPPASDARLSNLSTRALSLAGEHTLIPGFVVAGPGTKSILLRAVGPTLEGFGIRGALTDPRMSLHHGDEILAVNDDWETAPELVSLAAATDAVGAFPLAAGAEDAALLVRLPAGHYTVQVSSHDGSAGVALVELYDADTSPSASRLVNISNRGYVGTGETIMIPGFVVSPEGARTFLVRVVGPALQAYGVHEHLADPRLTIYRRRPNAEIDEPVLSNDDWDNLPGSATTAAVADEVGAFPLAPDSKDAALVVTLPPGLYTIHAAGTGQSTGVALVEIYLVP
ncbi:hypothetical protein ASA1KI_12080 [Opitutales bacterium ASA1]|nr:hypothetical protein ASA1KI_12080 [Opitutales bacterium ASA1]